MTPKPDQNAASVRCPICRGYHDPGACPWRTDTPKSVGREGMVTVWACDGLYLGCMGVETWTRLVEEKVADRA